MDTVLNAAPPPNGDDATRAAALEEACKLVNGSTRLAEMLTARLRPKGRTVSKASVSRWKTDRVPADVCPDIEDLTGVVCERLRPDINWSVLRRRRRTD